MRPILLSTSLLLSLVIASCKGGKETPSQAMIPFDTMKQVMWDMTVAGEYAYFALTKDSTKLTRADALLIYSKAFAIHHITPEQFKWNLDQYARDPDLEKRLMDSLQQYANKQREEYYKKRTSPLPTTPEPVKN